MRELGAEELTGPLFSPAEHADGEVIAILGAVVVERDIGEVVVAERSRLSEANPKNPTRAVGFFIL